MHFVVGKRLLQPFDSVFCDRFDQSTSEGNGMTDTLGDHCLTSVFMGDYYFSSNSTCVLFARHSIFVKLMAVVRLLWMAL